MDKLKVFIEDKKNMPIVAAVFGIVILGAAFFLLSQMGIIGGGGGGGDMSMSEPVGPPPADPAAPPPGEAVPPPPADPAAAPAQDQASAAPAAGQDPSKPAPMLPYRKDPFLPYTGVPTRKDVISVMLPSLRRPRIAPAPVIDREQAEVATEVVPPQPFRRMAGVMWNGRVSAILETNGETDIVRPGSEVNRGNSRVRVESITQDAVILKTLDTPVPMTIKVGMAGSVTGNSAVGGEPQGGPEMYPHGPY